MDLCWAYITASSAQEAKLLAHTLIEDRLAACVNIIPNVQSVYLWQGKIEEANEVTLIAKTHAKLFASLCERVNQLHSYDVPCIVQIPISGGHAPYLAWMRDNLKDSSES